MDIGLARTFLEVIAAGNFVSAAKRLNVTQSAISLRIKRLEGMLGTRVFLRVKSGTELTPAGRQFERFARSMVKVWEEARHQVTVPEGYRDRLVIGGQYSLLPRFVLRWLGRLEETLPNVAFRIEAGMPDRLIREMTEGVVDMAVMYRPQLRPGLRVEKVFDGHLVLVATDPKFGPRLDERYIFMDWGPEFLAAHEAAFPNNPVPRTTFAIGALGLNFVMRSGRAAYFPARLAAEHVEAGRLFVVPGAPTFENPVYLVTQTELAEDLYLAAKGELLHVVAAAEAAGQAVLEGATEET